MVEASGHLPEAQASGNAPAARALRLFHFRKQANVPQDTHDAFTLGFLPKIDRGPTVVIHDPRQLIGLVLGAADSQH